MDRRVYLIAAAAAALTVPLTAQPPGRMKGKVVTESGSPLEADVRMEAVAGPRGEGYVGQRTYTVHSNAKGEWSLIGIKAGAWMIAAFVDGQLPDAVVLPVNVLVPAGQGLAGVTPAWQPVLKPAPVPPGPAGQWLNESIAAAAAGDAKRAVRILESVPAEANAAALAAAGRVGLIAHDAGLAHALFLRALAEDPRLFRAKLGIGSAALMSGDFHGAGVAFKEARELTADKDERSYLTAAIADLSRMDISGP